MLRSKNWLMDILQSVQRLHQRDSLFFIRGIEKHFIMNSVLLTLWIFFAQPSKKKQNKQLKREQKQNEMKRIAQWIVKQFFWTIEWEKYQNTELVQSRTAQFTVDSKVIIHTRSPTEQLLITDFLFAYFIIFFFRSFRSVPTYYLIYSLTLVSVCTAENVQNCIRIAIAKLNWVTFAAARWADKQTSNTCTAHNRVC